MKKRIIAMLLSLSLLMGLCGCFPSEKKCISKGINTLTVNDLNSIPRHVKENPFENFVIDADVKIGIKESFNIYNAKLYRYGIEKWKNAIFKDLKILDKSTGAGESLNLVAEDGAMLHEETSYPSMSFYTNEEKENDLSFYIHPGAGGTAPNRDKDFSLKELDFMSSADALKMVKDVMNNLDLPIFEYDIYTVNYDYMQIKDEELKKFSEEFDVPDMYTPHTKDDEYYFIAMRSGIPDNGGLLTEIEYTVDAQSTGTIQITVNSGQAYAIVGKNGISYMYASGNYIIGDREKNDSIISLDEALSVIKKAYKSAVLQNKYNVYKIELAYTPVITNFEEENFDNDYKLKPSWVFHMAEETGDKLNGDRYFKKVIDATTGKEMMMLEQTQ